MIEGHASMKTNIHEVAALIVAEVARIRGNCQSTKSGGSFPKITPLPGSLHPEWRRCGKPTCRCARGEPHGPYVYHYWYEHGRRRKAYVPRDRVEAVAAGIAAWRRLHPPAWTMRQVLVELHRMEREGLG
jgi:hypothetical protein